ncbi:UNVERIFIED_CONTAM: hypothetical protein FKN15_073900 [Acipenser sinensis]
MFTQHTGNLWLRDGQHQTCALAAVAVRVPGCSSEADTTDVLLKHTGCPCECDEFGQPRE